MVCVWRLVLATFACVWKAEGFCCWWSATGDPCDCSETSKASNLATSLACVDGGGSWCSEDGEQSAPEDGEQSADAAPAPKAPKEAKPPKEKKADPAPSKKREAAPAPAPPPAKKRTGAIDVTDGCERNWLFQVSTGRSGSTSLMTMLNDLPNVYIAGENDGLFESLYALHKSSIRTESFANSEGHAWWHHPVERSKLERIARTYVESAIGLKQNQNYAWSLSSSFERFTKSPPKWTGRLLFRNPLWRSD